MGLRERFRAPASRPLIIAHRGVWGPAPENSVSAIKAARAYDMVEIDVQLSKDGIPVVMHDSTLMRTCGIDAAVSELTAAEFESFALREGAGGPDAALTTETPVRLDAALQAAEGLLVDVDVKRDDEFERIAQFLSSHPLRASCAIKTDVASIEDLENLRALEAQTQVAIQAKIQLGSTAEIALVKEGPARDIVSFEAWFEDAEKLREATETGAFVSIYTLDGIHSPGFNDARALKDPGAIWGRLLDLGVSAIMTDHPAHLASFLAARSA